MAATGGRLNPRASEQSAEERGKGGDTRKVFAVAQDWESFKVRARC